MDGPFCFLIITSSSVKLALHLLDGLAGDGGVGDPEEDRPV